MHLRRLGLGWFGVCAVAWAAPTATPYARAVAAKQAFLAEPRHTRAGYTRVMDGFRTIYHEDPATVHAADAVEAVAELLEQQGHELNDAKSLQAAVGQFEFLRTQYPASPLAALALVSEGRIYQDELEDQTAARDRYALELKTYPRTSGAAEAKKALAQLGHEAGSGSSAGLAKAAEPVPRGAAAMNGARGEAHASAAAVKAGSEQDPGSESPSGLKPLAQITGIRHWSTPTYTRVAIDLGDEVTFEAARVSHPDRIYFDLHGAKLTAELVNKSFDVTDDGFLKRIRAAQFSGDMTRVVLDVSEVSEYSAFLLPNPYRLIIDIHGTDIRGTGTRPAAGAAKALSVARSAEVAESSTPVAPGAGRQASAAANTSGLPAMAVTDGGEAVRPVVPAAGDSRAEATPVRPSPVASPRVGVSTRATPARPVPNTVALKAPDASTEVAAVSSQPGRVEATRAPTTRPIAATVKLPSAAPLADGGAAPELPTRKLRKNELAAPAKAADKTADGETSLIRALGLKIGRIVIDAGHGGHDSGTLGVDGIEEKDVVLDVALRLGKMLHERLGAEIIYTRSDDTFIPLETRTAIANKAQADLFLSIHANSSADASARGVETYYLNFTSSPDALDVAARENAVSGQSIHQLSDLVKKITLKDKISESREFAQDVESSLYNGLAKGNEGLKDRGVKKAPFVVLIGANMPSILAEISFVTNATDAGKLRTPEYRQRVAESLYNGVARYEAGLSGGRPVAPPLRAQAQ